jgi:hypothetical protein
MKIIALLLVFTLTSCTRNSYREIITKTYPDCEYVQLGEDHQKFLLRKKDGSVWEVELWPNGKIMSEAQLFAPISPKQ